MRLVLTALSGALALILGPLAPPCLAMPARATAERALQHVVHRHAGDAYAKGAFSSSCERAASARRLRCRFSARAADTAYKGREPLVLPSAVHALPSRYNLRVRTIGCDGLGCRTVGRTRWSNDSASSAQAASRIVLSLSYLTSDTPIATTEDDRLVFNVVSPMVLTTSIRNPPKAARRIRVRIQRIGCFNNCHTQTVSRRLGPPLRTSEGTFRSARVRTDRWSCGKPKVRMQVLSRSGRVLLTKRWAVPTGCGE